MTKTKRALQLRREGPPLTSLASLSTGTMVVFLKSNIMFSQVSPRPAQMAAVLTRVRTPVFPAAPASPGHVLGGSGGPSRMSTFACAYSGGGSHFVVSLVPHIC